MDLTPPSMIASPQSPYRRLTKSPSCSSHEHCHPEASAASYPSPGLLDFHYKPPPSPYGAVNQSTLSRASRSDASLTSQIPISHSGWTTSETMVPTTQTATTTSAISNLLSAEYDPFANYDLCLPEPYHSHDGFVAPSLPPPPPPHAASSILPRTSSPANTSSRMQNSVAGRNSLSFADGQATVRVKVESSNTYSPALTAAHYPTAPTLPTLFGHDTSSLSTNSQQYGPGDSVFNWPRHEYGANQLYPTPSSETSSRTQAPRRPAEVARRRPTRKHTTREEANFQCEVKGCGKFFSRSYNFKSHMETHDDKREYPFPCPMRDCDKKFVRKTDLQRHHQSVHMKERNHKCDYCGRHFARKDTLRR